MRNDLITDPEVLERGQSQLANVPENKFGQLSCFALTVDTEEEWDWSSGYPTGPACTTNIQALPRFQEECEKLGASVTYFTNYAVLQDPPSRKIIQQLAQHPNVEIGFHIHPWNTPPLAPVEKISPHESFLHNLPSDIGLAKLNAVLNAFLGAGIKPTSFRGGRYSTCGWIQDWLRDHGLLADASVLPFNTWKDDGAPDFRQRNLQPYRHAPRSENDLPLWELPLTFGFSRKAFPFWQKTFDAIENSFLSRLKVIGLLEKSRIVRKCWLNLEHPLGQKPQSFLKLLRNLKIPYLCCTLHSSSLVVGGNGYTRSEADLHQLYSRLREIYSLISSWPEIKVTTVTEAARHLEKQYHESSRN